MRLNLLCRAYQITSIPPIYAKQYFFPNTTNYVLITQIYYGIFLVVIIQWDGIKTGLEKSLVVSHMADSI
jgi:hypothetical protein